MDGNNHEILLHSSFVCQKDYWCDKLTQDTMLTTFRHVDTTDENDSDPRLETVNIELTAATNQLLAGFSKGSDLSLYIVLLTVLKVLIHRYTGQRDITVMSPVSILNLSDTTLNNHVWIRDHWQGDISFRDLVLQVKDSVIEAYQNQDYPSEQLLWHIFKEEGDIPQPPFTDICCLLDCLHNSDESLNTNESAAFCFHKQGNVVSGHILFDATRLNQGCIQRLARHYIALLEYFLNNKTAPVSEARFLSQQELRQLVDTFNDVEMELSGAGTVLDLFRRQVEANPEADAALSPRLSYWELDLRSNGIAADLMARGAGKGNIVAVMMPRSVDFLTAVLGVLKCGAAFLPIDVSYPPERREFMVADSGARIVLERVDNHERPLEELALPSLSPQDAAYVIYTSGSSGQPKGTVVEHGNLLNYVQWAAGVYVGDAATRFPLYTSISFDLTITSIFVPLATGNAIVLFDEDEPGLLVHRVFSSKLVDIVKCTPSHLKLIKEEGEMLAAAKTIRGLIVGGESLDTDLAEAISSGFHHRIAIYNEYGPTETTVGCVLHRFAPGAGSGGSVPIGKPAANVRIYVLNDSYNPVPIGGIGEIYISGNGVARGYLNRPQLTAERFCPDPFHPGNIMYKSGDSGRLLPDGTLEFLGRRDRQVKIRGVRLELGEIEAALRRHPQVGEAVVLGIDNRRAVTLAAYLAPSSAEVELEPQRLKEFLAIRLPAYNIPSLFFKVNSIPLTVNGKVDERALGKMGILLNPGARFVAPRDEMEQAVADIWQDVLELDQVGIEDNFFEIGGTSLELLKVNRLFNERFNRDIQVVTLFSYPNIKAFRSFLRDMETGGAPTLDTAAHESHPQSRRRLTNRKKQMMESE
jgi:fengycin family lipopeptide synthetase D